MNFFQPKYAEVAKHPEWMPVDAKEILADELPAELEPQSVQEFKQVSDAEQNFNLPPVEIPEHLPNWFEITAEALDDLKEDSLIGNAAALGKIAKHDANFARQYAEQLPAEAIEQLEQQAMEQALALSKELNDAILNHQPIPYANQKALIAEMNRLTDIARFLESADKSLFTSTMQHMDTLMRIATTPEPQPQALVA